MKNLALVAAFLSVFVVGHAQTSATLRLLQQADLIYQGAFRVPNVGSKDADGFPYGGTALAFNPAHGSLFLVGFELTNKVSEISIPAPGTGVASALPMATTLQPLADVTEGKLPQVNPGDPNGIRIGGLLPWGDRLIISAFAYYDGAETQKLSHFASGQTLATTGDLQGPFQVGSTKAGYVSGYMGVVPPAWRAALGGPAFTGQCCIAIVGRTSSGPAVSTFDPADLGVNKTVRASPLVYYGLDHPLGAYGSVNPYYNGSTEIKGVVMPEGTRSVLFFGKHGSTFCYGAGTTDQALDRKPVPKEPGVMFCYDPQDQNKGTHGYPYRYQVWAYDANDLAAVKAGKKNPWDPKPYATWGLTLPVASGSTRIAGATYDPETGRIFIAQWKGEDAKPVIHVFTIGSP